MPFDTQGNSLIVYFGFGDTLLVHAGHPDEPTIQELVIWNKETELTLGERISETEFQSEWHGKKTDEIEGPNIRLQFNCVESVDILIEELQQVKRRIIRGMAKE